MYSTCGVVYFDQRLGYTTLWSHEQGLGTTRFADGASLLVFFLMLLPAMVVLFCIRLLIVHVIWFMNDFLNVEHINYK